MSITSITQCVCYFGIVCIYFVMNYNFDNVKGEEYEPIAYRVEVNSEFIMQRENFVNN